MSRSSTTIELLDNIHPGEILFEEFIKPFGLSQSALAKSIGVPPRRINEIVLGKRAITADTGLRLSRYFGMSEGFFLGLQKDYELMEERRRLSKTLLQIRPLQATANEHVPVGDLLDAIHPQKKGVARWNEVVKVRQQGVYIVLRPGWKESAPKDMGLATTDVSLRDLWTPRQTILYIGSTRRELRQRLTEYFRHRFGRHAPHKGGEWIKKLPFLHKCEIVWAVVDDPTAAEQTMLRLYKERTGRLPFANRRGAKAPKISEISMLAAE
jgi:addiction module HigA family antidote